MAQNGPKNKNPDISRCPDAAAYRGRLPEPVNPPSGGVRNVAGEVEGGVN